MKPTGEGIKDKSQLGTFFVKKKSASEEQAVHTKETYNESFDGFLST